MISSSRQEKGILVSKGLTTHAMPNPSINPDWRDKAAPAGYVKR